MTSLSSPHLVLSSPSGLVSLRADDGETCSHPHFRDSHPYHTLCSVSSTHIAAFSPEGTLSLVPLDPRNETIQLSASSSMTCPRAAYYHLPTGTLYHSSDGRSLHAHRLCAPQHSMTFSGEGGHRDSVSVIDSVPSLRNRLFTGSMDGTVMTWDLSRLERLSSPPLRHLSPVTSLAHHSSSPCVLVSGSTDSTLRFWDLRTSASSSHCPVSISVSSGVSCLLSNHGTHLLHCASYDSTLCTFDLRNVSSGISTSPLAKLSLPDTVTGPVRSLASSPVLTSDSSSIFGVSLTGVFCVDSETYSRVEWSHSERNSCYSNGIIVYLSETIGLDFEEEEEGEEEEEENNFWFGNQWTELNGNFNHNININISNSSSSSSTYLLRSFLHDIPSTILSPSDTKLILYGGGGWTLLEFILEGWLDQEKGRLGELDQGVIVMIRSLLVRIREIVLLGGEEREEIRGISVEEEEEEEEEEVEDRLSLTTGSRDSPSYAAETESSLARQSSTSTKSTSTSLARSFSEFEFEKRFGTHLRAIRHSRRRMKKNKNRSFSSSNRRKKKTLSEQQWGSVVDRLHSATLSQTQKKIQSMREVVHQSRVAECSFQPAINPNSTKMVGGKGQRVALSERVTTIMEERANRLESQIRERERREEAEASNFRKRHQRQMRKKFQGEVPRWRGGRNLFEWKVARDATRMKRKQDNERREVERHSFSPKINRKSRQIALNKKARTPEPVPEPEPEPEPKPVPRKRRRRRTPIRSDLVIAKKRTDAESLDFILTELDPGTSVKFGRDERSTYWLFQKSSPSTSSRSQGGDREDGDGSEEEVGEGDGENDVDGEN